MLVISVPPGYYAELFWLGAVRQFLEASIGQTRRGFGRNIVKWGCSPLRGM